MNEDWITRLRECVERDGRSMRKLSVEAGLGPNFLQQLFSTRKDPGFGKLARLLNVLGSDAPHYVVSGIRMDREEAEMLRLLRALPEPALRDTARILLALADRSGPD